MLAFLASVRDLCLFRRGPEEMPYSPRWLIALLIACAVLEAAFDLHTGAKPGMVVAALVAGLAVVGCVFLLLRGRGKSERFVQTASSLAVVKLLFGVIAYPLTLLLPLEQILVHKVNPADLTGGQTLVMLVVAVLGAWELCVWIGILRRALDIPLVGGVIVFILLVLVNVIVMAFGAGIAGAV